MSDDFSLKDLIDPKHPSMECLRSKAPGTYKHCQNVANFVEAVAIELDLDTDAMRVAAMYHDIGKCNFPEGFSENQNGKNIHDDLEPIQSYTIITKHVGDTVLKMISMKDMPRKIIEWASQHHGDTVLRYFYDKEKSKKETKYRYRSDKPQSTESAVLMICDSVEAKARSYAANGKFECSDDIDQLVLMSVGRLEMDGQLDNVLTGHLRRIKQTLINELNSMYHKRELYPEDKEEEEKIIGVGIGKEK